MKVKKNRWWILAWLLAFVLVLGACKTPEPVNPTEATEKAEEGPDDVPIVLEPAGNVIDKYTKDDTDYLSKPEEATKYVHVHYRRNDDFNNDRSSYQAWNLWIWDMTNGGNGEVIEFTHYDDYGVYAVLDLDAITKGKPAGKIGFIVRTDNWAKDPDGDRVIEVNPTSPGGVQEVYVRTAEATMFDSVENACKSIVSYALLRDSKTVSVYFKPLSDGFKAYAPRVSMTVNGQPYTAFTVGEYSDSFKKVDLTLQDSVDLSDVVTVSYRFDPTWTCSVDLMMTNYYDTAEFNERYAYEGTDLGATFDNEKAPTKTIFKVWAPTSTKMVLNLYKTGNYETDKTPEATYEMTKGEKGVFSVTVNQDLDGKYYTYTVTNSKGTNEVVDPYAKSSGVNGRRGMVVNFTKLNASIEGWAEDVRPFDGPNVDAVIYEAHVRDMTISETSGVAEQYRGKFLGLAETGTTFTKDGVTVTTGLDHLKELGITHIQLQPFYDYSSVDETCSGNVVAKENYNWGYDPLNYNVLEGSYSTDPYDGYNRIREFKTMVLALHEAGISINMDVVYNHTSGTENSNLNLLVPYYYYRTKASGAFYNGSGCGNELASERYMVNKMFRESCKFWIDEYHLSGFRFDLMGLIDNQTMIDIYKDCAEIYPAIMIYGEPWAGGSTKLKGGTDPSKLSGQMTVQASLAEDYFSGSGVLVGAFNDVIRNAVRGDNSPGKSYVQGISADQKTIAATLKGVFSGNGKAASIDPNLVLQYVACHDNYTLYDQLVQTMKENRLEAAYVQADAIILLAEGVPFIQEGEEFMRSKLDPETGTYSGNSYNVGDFINVMDYSLKIEHQAVYEKIRELIALRAAEPAFRLSSRADIEARMKNVTADAGVIRYELDDALLVIHSNTSAKIELDGAYEVLFSNFRNAGERLSGEITVHTNESLVLRKEP